MDTRNVLDLVQNLTDLELAVLLSLVTQQHCLITTEDDSQHDLAAELALVVSEVFNLSYVVVSHEDQTSVDDFGAAILDHGPAREFAASDYDDDGSTGMQHSRLACVDIRAGDRSGELKLDRRMVVNVIIAKDFNFAPKDVQIAALELMQKRRIYSKTTVHPVPKAFLFIPLVCASSKDVRLTHHLNDRIAISHHHDSEDGFANLEEIDTHAISDQDSDRSSNTSVDAHTTGKRQHIDHKFLDQLRSMGAAVRMTPDIRRYIQDIVVFLRIQRTVDGGITPTATNMLVGLCKHLAPLHGIDYVTPSLVALAAKKIYPHRLIIATPQRDRSMQYGSDLEAVTDVMADVDAEGIVDHVINIVQCPA